MKTLALLAGLLATTLHLQAAPLDLGQPVPASPYEVFMGNVKAVLRPLKGEGASMQKAEALMTEGRAFAYSFTDPFNTASPKTTAALRAGDCKAKSLWLCDRLSDKNVRFVIGKVKANSPLNHAWVLWQHDGKWWVLDCTRNDHPVELGKISRSEYIPLYSYDRKGVFRHSQS